MRDTRDFSRLLRRLSWVRLLACGVLLAAGALTTQWGGLPFGFTPFVLWLAAAAASSGVFLAVQRKIVHLRRFAWLQLVLDVVLSTAIVAVTGGPRSIFNFLYVLSVTAGCVLLSRRAGLLLAGLASLLYSGFVMAQALLPPSAFVLTEATALSVLTTLMTTGSLLIVAILAGSLAERSRRADRELETRGRNLKDLELFKDLIFESVGSGLVALDRQGHITAYNRAAEEITGFSAREACGRHWETIFGRGIRLDEAMADGDGEDVRARRQETLLTRKDGRNVPLGISFWPLRSGDGQLDGLVGVCQDLSDIKQMEERMRQADRLAAIGRLAANIAHEIRNPLAALSGAIEQLTHELSPNETQERLMQIVLRESRRLNRIISEFLDYARPAPLRRQTVNVAELLDEVALLLERHPLAEKITIVRNYAAALSAEMDAHQFRQALWNLSLNAAQAMPDGGTLTIGARVMDGSGSRLEVWVTDTGQGIERKDLPHIFEPFYSTRPGGTGLGLALVHRVVEEHGGTVKVRSAPGTGTTFVLRLPLPLPFRTSGESGGDGAARLTA